MSSRNRFYQCSVTVGRQRLLLVIILATGLLFFSPLKYQVLFCVSFISSLDLSLISSEDVILIPPKLRQTLFSDIKDQQNIV